MTETPPPPAADLPRASSPAAPTMFIAIEGLRGVSILVVMLFHAIGQYVLHLLPGAFFIVDFFYALSGFVLSHVYGARLAKGLGCRGFMRLRLIRIYPLYLLALFIAVGANLGIALTHGLPEPGLFLLSIAASALLIPLAQSVAWRHHHPYPFNGTTWTLLWELVVNVIWSTLGPRLTNRLLALFIAIGVAMLLFALSLPTGLEHGGAFSNFHVGGLRVVYGFFAGIAAYRLWERGCFPWLRLPFWGSALALMAIICLRPINGNFIYDLCAALIMPALVFASTSTVPPRLIPLFAGVGRITYAAYILNFPILLVLDQILPRLGLPILTSVIVRVPLFIALTLGVSFAADRWLDHPMRVWLSRKFASGNRGHAPGDRPVKHGNS